MYIAIIVPSFRKRKLIPLQEVPADLQEAVYNAVKDRFPEIRMPPYGTQVSDGYRPPVERAPPPPFHGGKYHAPYGDGPRKSRAGLTGTASAR